MTTDWFLGEVQRQIEAFDCISLADMDSVKLMDRTDTKYLIPLATLPNLLVQLADTYRVLTIQDKQLCGYQTLYYDTPDLRLYHAHQSGKLNRFKVRSRTYVESAISFFEVKRKNNKGRTVKKRIQQSGISLALNPETQAFLSKFIAMDGLLLEGRFWVDYTRITLVSKASAERLTIDLNLTFRNDHEQISYPELAIAELKQDRAVSSACRQLMKQLGIRQGAISKYCFGVMNLYQPIKQNNFKRHWQTIRKTQQQHATIATATYNRANRNLVAV